jgi:hypothetical protein
MSSSAFGRIQKGGAGFMFLADKFINFLAMLDIEAFCEHIVFKIKAFTNSQHFIRVGSVNFEHVKALDHWLGMDQGYTTSSGACKQIS